jgi:hypothetical protein
MLSGKSASIQPTSALSSSAFILSRSIVAERIVGCREYADAQTQFLIHIENNQTFTTNTHYLADYKEKFTTYYKSVRKDQEGKTSFVEGVVQGLGGETDFAKSLSEVIAHLTKMGLSVDPQELIKLMDSDVDEDVIDIMAEVRAYYQGEYTCLITKITLTKLFDSAFDICSRVQALCRRHTNGC